MPVRIGGYPLFDDRGMSFFDRLQQQLEQAGFEAKYNLFDEGVLDENNNPSRNMLEEFARFSIRPQGGKSWLELNVAPGPESVFGQSVMLPSTGEGGTLFGPEAYVPEKGDPVPISPMQAFTGYVGAAFADPTFRGHNITQKFWEAMQRPNPAFQTAGGVISLNPFHSATAIQEYANRIGIGYSPNLPGGVMDALERIRNIRENMLAVGGGGMWGKTIPYTPFNADEGGPVTLRNILQQTGSGEWMGVGADPAKFLKNFSVVGPHGRGQREEALPLTWTGKGIGLAPAQPITGLQTNAGYRELNAIYPGEDTPRSSVVIPGMLHTPETPTPGGGMTYGSPLQGVYGFGIQTRARQKLQFENVGQLAATNFDFGIFERESFQNTTLQSLMGYGLRQREAQAIIDYRTRGGRLPSPSDITSIPGVGKTSAKKLQSMLAGNEWIKTRELEGAVIPAGQTATWGLVRYGDKTIPLQQTAEGDDYVFTSPPNLTVPRYTTQTGEVVSAQEPGAIDLFEASRGLARGTYGQKFWQTVQQNFGGDVRATGLHHIEVSAPMIKMTGVKATEALKATLGQAAAPQGAPYTPTVQMGDLQVQPSGAVGNIKSLPGVFGGMFAALPSNLQAQLASDIGFDPGVLGLGQGPADYSEMTRRYNAATGQSLNQIDLMQKMLGGFVSQARQRPEYFMQTYEMGVTPKGQNVDVPFGYVNAFEKQGFEQAYMDMLALKEPKLTESQRRAETERMYKFRQDEATGMYEMSYSSPALYGPLVFTPSPEYMTKTPSFTREELAAVNFNFPELANSMDFGMQEQGVPGHVSGWRSLGRMYQLKQSFGGEGMIPPPDIRTDISSAQIKEITQLAREQGGTIENYEAAMEELMPGARDILYTQSGQMIPHPRVARQTSEFTIGVDTEGRPLQGWARRYGELFTEGLLEGEGGPKSALNEFWTSLELAGSSKGSKMYQHTARRYLRDMIGGRYNAQLGLPTDYGGDNILVQDPVLLANRSINQRILQGMAEEGNPLLGMMARQPFLARTSGLKGAAIWSVGAAETASGMQYGRSTGISRSGEPVYGNPFLRGFAGGTSPLAIREFIGDFDADPILLKILQKAGGDLQLLKQLSIPRTYEEQKARQALGMREAAWHEQGIAGARFDEMIKTAGDLRAASRTVEDFFGQPGGSVTTPQAMWESGESTIQSEMGMGTSYNLRRWLEETAALKGFGKEALAAGHSARMPNYQGYLDKSLTGTALEKMFTTASWREDAGAVGLVGGPGVGPIWPGAQRTGGQGLQTLTQQLRWATSETEILNPIDRAFMLSSTPADFEMAQKMLDDGADWDEVEYALTNKEGFDPRNTNLYGAMAASATRKLFGAAGARQSTSVGSDTGIAQRTQNLARFRKHPGISVELFPGQKALHPGEFMQSPQIRNTITGYQTQDPRAGMPSASDVAAYLTLAEQAAPDTPTIQALRTNWGGDVFQQQYLAYQAVKKSGQAGGEGYLEEVRESARRRGVNTGSAGAGAGGRMESGAPASGGGGQQPPGGGAYIPTGDEESPRGGGGSRRGGDDPLNVIFRFSGNRNEYLQMKQIAQGAASAAEYGPEAKEFVESLNARLDEFGVRQGPAINRVIDFIRSNPMGSEQMKAFASEFFAGPKGTQLSRAASNLFTAQNAWDAGMKLPGLGEIINDPELSMNLGTAGWMDVVFDRSAQRKGKNDFTNVDFDKFLDNFNKLHDAVGQSAERFKDLNKQLDKMPADRQQRAREASMAYQIGMDQLPQARQRVLDALESGDQDLLSQRYNEYRQVATGVRGAEGILEREMEGRGARLRSGFRRTFGGWGLMYMTSMLGLGSRQFQQGYAEYDALAQAGSMGMAGMFGAEAISPYEGRELAYQRAMTRQGGNTWALIRQAQGQLGLADVGGAIGTGIGLAGIATHVGGAFNMLPAALGTVAGVAGAAGVVGALGLQQYSYMQAPEDTMRQSVAESLSGHPLAAAWKSFGLERDVPKWAAAIPWAPGQALATIFAPKSEWAGERDLLKEQTTAALAGGFRPGELDPTQIARISQVAAQVENTPLNVLPTELAQQLEQYNIAGGWGFSAETLADIGVGMQAGLPTQELAQGLQWASGGGYAPPQELLGRMRAVGRFDPKLQMQLLGATQLAQQMPGAQRYMQQYGDMSTLMQLRQIMGGPNEQQFMQAWNTYAQGSALGLDLGSFNFGEFNRYREMTPQDLYAQGQQNYLGGVRNQVFGGLQQMGMDYGLASRFSMFAGSGMQESRFAQGLMQMDPYRIQQMAMAGAGGIYNELANMDINPQGELTGLSWGTTSLARGNLSSAFMGQQILGDLAGTEAGQAAIAGGTRGLGWWQFEQNYEAQTAQMGIQAQRLALQEQYQPLFWNIEDRQRDLSRRQQEWGFQYQQQMFDVQGQQFNENMAFQRQQQLRNRTWTMQDWGYQDTMRSMQWGWQQEDFQANVRFMTGRDRRQAERQMERQTIMYGMEGDRIDVQRNRQKQLWASEDERHELTMRHHQEVREIQEENMKKQIQFYEESKKLQDESTKLHREYWEKNMELNKAALGIQEEQLQKNKEYAEVVKRIAQAQEDYQGKWRLAQMKASETVETLIEGFDHFLKWFPDAIEAMLKGEEFSFPTFDTSTGYGMDQGSAWNDYFVGALTGGTSSGGTTNISINIGNEHLGSYMVNAVEDELKVAV